MINIGFFENIEKSPERFIRQYEVFASNFLKLIDITQLILLISQWDDGSMMNQLSLI